MPRFRIKISDSVTYSREASLDIEARDEEHATEIAETMTDTFRCPPESLPPELVGTEIDLVEEQTDADPWEIEVKEIDE